MGTQIFMEVKDLLAAHCSVKLTSFHEGKEFDTAFVQARVSMPNTTSSFDTFTMNVTDDLQTLWSDYNEWSSGPERLSSFVKRLNIPHIIS
jgi:long-subunit fatty acid transport protein